jgi:diguanylate cyclase (GGDEF)-like protein/PAS domain S-box-containing protein
MNFSYDLRLLIDRAGHVVQCDDPTGVLSKPHVLQSKLPGRTIGELIPYGMADIVAAAVAKEQVRPCDPDASLQLATVRNVTRCQISVSTAPGPTSKLTEVVLRWAEIAEQTSVDERLRLAEARHRLWSENSDDVIWTMAADGSITYVSPAVEQMRGFTQAEAIRQSIDEILTPVSQAAALTYYAQVREAVAAGLTPRTYRGDQEYKCKDGSTVWTEVLAYPLLDEAGQLIELIGVTRDISERKQHELALNAARQAACDANNALERANAELRELAATDAMTGARSRRYLESRTVSEIAAAERHRKPLSLIFFDVDRFKLINDQFGHDGGDRIIAAVADVAGTHLPPDGVLARWGGDEFVVLLPGCALPDALRIAETIRSDMESRQPIIGAGVTLSLGIAEWRAAESPREWFKRADLATYMAKKSGRNTISVG